VGDNQLDQFAQSLHTLIYGDSGAGKSTAASTYPYPQLVFMFDPYGKELPYKKALLRAGAVMHQQVNQFGTPVEYLVMHDAEAGQDVLKCQIEHYIDTDPRKPIAFERFLQRLDVFDKELPQWQTGTLILDSITFAELSARKWSQYKLNPNSKEPRQWFAASTDMLEEMVMIRLGSMPMRVVVIAHIDEDKDEVHGEIVRNPSAPGRLRKRSPAGYSELYRQYVMRDQKTAARQYLWQTRSGWGYNCNTQLDGLSDPCLAEYASVEAVLKAGL
jgi:hypothetical protein